MKVTLLEGTRLDETNGVVKYFDPYHPYEKEFEIKLNVGENTLDLDENHRHHFILSITDLIFADKIVITD